MKLLIIGLLLFLGVHSTRIVAEAWRTPMLSRLGPNGWKITYSVLSLVGIVLVSKGYAQARLDPTVLWGSAVWLRHVAAVLTLVAFVMVAAAYVPRNAIKARLRHPMVVGVKVWAFAHLLANNTLADLLLFGGFLLWAVLSFRAARARDRAVNAPAPASTLAMTGLTVFVGLLAWVAFAFWAHAALMGVHPFIAR